MNVVSKPYCRRKRSKQKNRKERKRYFEQPKVITLDEPDEEVQIKEETKSESEMDVVGIPSISTQEIPVQRYFETFNKDLTQGD